MLAGETGTSFTANNSRGSVIVTRGVDAELKVRRRTPKGEDARLSLIEVLAVLRRLSTWRNAISRACMFELTVAVSIIVLSVSGFISTLARRAFGNRTGARSDGIRDSSEGSLDTAWEDAGVVEVTDDAW